MLKRVRWLALGAAGGAAGTLWGQRKLKATARRYSAAGLAGEAATRARALRGDVLDSLAEGRDAMRQREAHLRSRPAADPVGSPTGE